MPKIIAEKTDWVELGYALFSNHGISGIIVEKMAKTLGCNKSSFYWHFKSKSDFISAIVDHWINQDTHQIVKTVSAIAAPADQFKTLVAHSCKQSPHINFIFFLKQYAETHPEFKTIIDQIDEERLNFTSHILEAMGFDPLEAMIKANIFYQYLIGYHEMIRYKPQDKDYLKQVLSEIKHFIPFEDDIY